MFALSICLSGNKDHSNTPNRISLNFNTLLQERSQDISKKALRPPSSRSFSKLLFENVRLSVPIREHALKTKFIQGMTVGSLRPTQYGRYMIQDIAYLYNAVKVYSEAAQKMEAQRKPDFAFFYWRQAKKYEEYYQGFLKTWDLESAEEVHRDPAVQAYMGYQQGVVKKHPRYLPIAMLPCTMLWPWMAASLIENVDKQNPYYEDWFVKNLREPDTQSSTERFVDQNSIAFDEGTALKIFCEGMMNELNFFREACDEAPYKLSDICPVAG